MPLRLEADRLVFQGVCPPEEADRLLEWLRAAPVAGADLAACTQLHTALLQLLMAAGVPLLAPPDEPVLAAALRDCLPPPRVAAGEEKNNGAPPGNLLETSAAPDWAEQDAPPGGLLLEPDRGPRQPRDDTAGPQRQEQ